LQELSSIIGTSAAHIETPRALVSQAVQPEPRPLAAAAQPVVARNIDPTPPPANREFPAQPGPNSQPQRAFQQDAATGLRGSLGMERARPAEPRPAPSVPEPALTRREDGQGWISDLLRSASREEAAVSSKPATETQNTAARGDTRNPRHVVESLNSLSVDIARAIDHDASVELWRRYQRGERDVFTRRLYTLKGQQTFDDIKRKYDREPEFRSAVDRYIGDFEKLLADVARNDRDRTLTQTYLTSDTGKVYTMLAHAAGRLN
jgi:hypothetical protein